MRRFPRFFMLHPDENDQGGGGNPVGGTPSGSQPAKTFTQEDLDRVVQREKAQAAESARRAAEKQLADKFGVSLEDAEKMVKEQREAQEREKTEAQKAREAAEAEKRAASEELQQARTLALGAKVMRALIKAGVKVDKVEKAARLVDVEPGADDAAIEAAVESAKEDIPELFGGGGEGQPSKKPPSSDPQGGGSPRATGAREDAKKRAQERIEARKARLKRSA